MGSEGDGQQGASAGRGQKYREKQLGMGSPLGAWMERADASVWPCSSQKPSWTTILRGGRRNQCQGEMVGAQDLLRQVALVGAGQCP